MTTVTTEEYDLMKDSKYRLYVAAVDKALKNFDYTSEWADLISALGKLNKVLLSYTKFPVIPRRIKISKRLAQCMHPALPSGVHLKALETYDIIFRCMGTNRLSCELFIYSAGLFPLMGHAAMNIRPTLLTLYETHFVPLRDRLRPALSGFLNGILPGLDTGSDHFERTNLLLENVCDGVEPTYFYTCIWQCITNNGLVRLPAISYVLAHFSRKLPMEDQLYLMGHDIGLMVSGICSAVQDSSVLVQRSALDLLVVCFPMQNKQLLYADMVRLVTASLSTILRRDMSLNRRLYSWLLEQEVSNLPLLQIEGKQDQQDQVVITNYQLIAYDLLNDAIKVILKKCSTESPIDVKPYRLLTSLFDKPQIGPVILDNILYDVFRTLYLSCLHHQKYNNSSVRCVSFNGDLSSLNSEENILNKQFVTKNCQELVKNANLLFNTLQDYYIWSYIEKLYQDATANIKCNMYRDRAQVNDIGSGLPHILEICILTDFLLDIIPIESYAESTSEILPKLFRNIIYILRSNINELNQHEITDSLQLCIKILTKIQPTPPVQLQTTEVGDNELLVNKSIDSSLEKSLLESNGDQNEEQRTLEKSKSDSKINENLSNFESETLAVNDASRGRSNSNQMSKKKDRYSPRIEKKSKNKKSKSSSKLYDLRKADNNEVLVFDATDKWQEASIKDRIGLPDRIANIENRYIITCLEEYKHFYVRFIETKVLPDINIKTYFQKFICDNSDRTNQLQKLLDARLCEKSTGVFVPVNRGSSLGKRDTFSAPNLTSERIISAYEKSMDIASSMLLEFSSFPNLLRNYTQEGLPAWILALIVAACSNGSSRTIQITTMSTFLEIFVVANNQILNKPPDCNTNVVTTGILDLHHIKYIKENTIVIEEMSKILWTLLGYVNDQYHLMLCITLLYQIHNIFDSNLFVEQVIGNFLTRENINENYMKQFFLLWNLGRDLNIKLPPNKSNVKNFDRCLLKILDNLENKENPNLQLLVETFLTHGLLHNDISRIINPILLKLLASNTARVSIRHVNIDDSDTQSDTTSQDNNKMIDAQAKNVYAVSSINGNIMYHISHCSSPKPKKKWFTFSKTGKKYSSSVINMTTSLAENSNVVTKKNKEFKGFNTSPILDKGSRDNVKLIINPLGSKEVYPIGLNGLYSKLDSHSSLESLSSATESMNISNGNADSLDTVSNKKECTITPQLQSLSPNLDGIKSHSSNFNINSGRMTKSHSLDEEINNMKINDMENSLVQSWSYCISDSANLNCELELSKSAEDFFKSKSQEHTIVSSIVNDIIDKVCSEVDDAGYTSQSLVDLKPKMNTHISKNFFLYPIHSHLCLYYEIFDTNQVFYALQTLKNCILSNPALFIKCLATSGIQNLKHNKILNLLARHRKSLLGYGFSGELSNDHIHFYRGYMFLDVIITTCLNYSRSFYPCLDDVCLTADEINNNTRIQLESLEILDIIVRNLITIVEKNSKGFLSYIGDLLVKSKLQKILLNSLLISVRNFDEEMTFAEEILKFNNFHLFDSNKVGENVQAFQVQVLRLIHSLIILEHAVFPLKLQIAETNSGTNGGEHLNVPVVLIPQQQIFLSAILSALRHQNTKHIHERWLNMVTSCLPYFGDNLKQICISVILQICTSIEEIANNYKKNEVNELCSDYAVTQLEALTILCHYCLLDSSQTVNQNVPTNPSTPVSNPGEIINNLVNAFFSPLSLDVNLSSKQNSDNYQHARKTILSHMPRIISSIAKFWQTIVTLENDYNGVYGNSKVVKQQLLEFLSPISLHHGACFLAAISVTWYERRNSFGIVKTVLPEPNAGQSNLVLLILAIRVIPLDNLVQTVTSVIKNPPPTEGLSDDICLDVCVLELFYCYMRNASATQLSDAWTSLLNLIREGCSLSPPAQFLLAAILHELMIKCCPLEDRKDQRDLQDVTAKLIDSVSQVCGSCLEQTTWLRKNFAVKEQDEDNTPESSIISGSTSEIFVNYNHSVQAQTVLSEILAPILDICFGSSEKDKVNGILVSLMCNIVPYLKTHRVRNIPSFTACSKLLSSLSSYQYTRKSWKKEVTELLLDNNLFQMDHSCLKYWRIIVDNLMTHDNITFRDLMNRVSMNQSGSLSIFSSREQEYEQKAQLLKRLAFVIFCSEVDQYAKYMPDIQEQLTSSLRSNVHGIQAQVFFCFRVILIRMSPQHVTSLWPIIISEMLQVFLQLEQELSAGTDEFSSQMKLMSSLDQSWSSNSSNHGLQVLGNSHWLQLQLTAAKLLDLALLLPTTTLPQFQMYRWAFVGDDLIRRDDPLHQISFLPHVVRIADLMDKKYLDTQIDTLPMKRNELLLTMSSITHLKNLHSFFKTLSSCSNSHRTECIRSVHGDYCFTDKQSDRKLNMILEKIDKAIELDFLDKISR